MEPRDSVASLIITFLQMCKSEVGLDSRFPIFTEHALNFIIVIVTLPWKVSVKRLCSPQGPNIILVFPKCPGNPASRLGDEILETFPSVSPKGDMETSLNRFCIYYCRCLHNRYLTTSRRFSAFGKPFSSSKNVSWINLVCQRTDKQTAVWSWVVPIWVPVAHTHLLVFHRGQLRVTICSDFGWAYPSYLSRQTHHRQTNCGSGHLHGKPQSEVLQKWQLLIYLLTSFLTKRLALSSALVCSHNNLVR